jgi:hypothetical protein
MPATADPAIADSSCRLYEFAVLSRSSLAGWDPDPPPSFEIAVWESNGRFENPAYKVERMKPPGPFGLMLEDRYVRRYDTKLPWCLFNVMIIERA